MQDPLDCEKPDDEHEDDDEDERGFGRTEAISTEGCSNDGDVRSFLSSRSP
jgi:hypothetical protein